uniref:Uncharacterized protein n=1 Tax=Triticum urartu TaxID=4572 RepID=A0A8R7QPV4_TRIUA
MRRLCRLHPPRRSFSIDARRRQQPRRRTTAPLRNLFLFAFILPVSSPPPPPPPSLSLYSPYRNGPWPPQVGPNRRRRSLRRACATGSAACAVPIPRFGGVRPPSRVCTPKPLRTPPAGRRFAPPCIPGWVTSRGSEFDGQERRTWSEAFLVAAHTGQVFTAGSHAPHRDRCRQWSSRTQASHGDGAGGFAAAGARRPAAMTSWLLATPRHAWPSTVICTHAMAAAPSSSSTKPSHPWPSAVIWTHAMAFAPSSSSTSPAFLRRAAARVPLLRPRPTPVPATPSALATPATTKNPATSLPPLATEARGCGSRQRPRPRVSPAG